MNSIEYRKQESAHLEKARQITETADLANRDLTAEEKNDFDNEVNAAQSCREKYSRLERLEEAEKDRNESAGRYSRSQQPELPRETSAKYSFTKAINDWLKYGKITGLEKECSDELAIKSGKPANGFYMPWTLPMGRQDRYAVNTTAISAGQAALVAPEFIDVLRNRMVVQQAGATVLTGMTGASWTYPKQNAFSTATWVAQGNAASASNPQVQSQVTLAPETLTCYADITRRSLLTSSFDAEQFVRNDLATGIALGIDKAALSGSGDNNEPEGILSHSSLQLYAMNSGLMEFLDLVALESNCLAVNASIGRAAYVTTPAVVGSLKSSPKTEYGSSFCIENNLANGYAVYGTNQLEADDDDHPIIFSSDWSDLLIGFWSPLDILVDQFTGSSTGTVRIVAMIDLDVAVRRIESFVASIDVGVVNLDGHSG